MFGRIFRALLPLEHVAHEACAPLHTGTARRSMPGTPGVLSALLGTPGPRVTGGSARQQLGTLPASFPPTRNFSSIPSHTFAVPIPPGLTGAGARLAEASVRPVSAFPPTSSLHQSVFEHVPANWSPPVRLRESDGETDQMRSAPSSPTAEPTATPRVFTDLRAPTSLEEEQAQLHLALEQSRTEAFLKALPAVGENFDAAATAGGSDRTVWKDLPPDIRQHYPSELEYDLELASTLTNPRHIEQALSRAGMHAVPNDGITAEGRNNCFLISMSQHETSDYSSSHPARVDHYRDILNTAPDLNLAANEKLSADSPAAHALVDLINGDPSVQPKLKVIVISVSDGVVHQDHLGSSAPDARTVVIWDKGGHFEAVTGPIDIASHHGN